MRAWMKKQLGPVRKLDGAGTPQIEIYVVEQSEREGQNPKSSKLEAKQLQKASKQSSYQGDLLAVEDYSQRE